MLCLTRKKGQRIFIGPDVTIYVNRISGNQVSIGIDAPREVTVLRAELTEDQEPLREQVGAYYTPVDVAMGAGAFLTNPPFGEPEAA